MHQPLFWCTGNGNSITETSNMKLYHKVGWEFWRPRSPDPARREGGHSEIRFQQRSGGERPIAIVRQRHLDAERRGRSSTNANDGYLSLTEAIGSQNSTVISTTLTTARS